MELPVAWNSGKNGREGGGDRDRAEGADVET